MKTLGITCCTLFLLGCAEAPPPATLDLHGASASFANKPYEWGGKDGFVRFATARLVSPETASFELVLVRDGQMLEKVPMPRRGAGLYDYDAQVTIKEPGRYRVEVRVGETLVGFDPIQVGRIYRLDGAVRQFAAVVEPPHLYDSRALVVSRPAPQDLDPAWRVEWTRDGATPMVATGRDNVFTDFSSRVEDAVGLYHLKELNAWKWAEESYQVPAAVLAAPEGWRVRVNRQGVAPLGARFSAGKLVAMEVPEATPAIERELAAVKPLPQPPRGIFHNPVRCGPAEVRALVRSAEVRQARIAINAEAQKGRAGAPQPTACGPAMNLAECVDHQRKESAAQAAWAPELARELRQHMAKAKQLGVPYLALVARVGKAPWRADEIP